jgi:hypothetical protein
MKKAQEILERLYKEYPPTAPNVPSHSIILGFTETETRLVFQIVVRPQQAIFVSVAEEDMNSSSEEIAEILIATVKETIEEIQRQRRMQNKGLQNGQIK